MSSLVVKKKELGIDKIGMIPLILAITLAGCVTATSGITDPSRIAMDSPTIDETNNSNPDSNSVYYYYVLGHMMMGERRWEEAEKAFIQVAKKDPLSIEARLIVAHLATQRGDLSLALQYAQEVVKLDPNHIKARMLLAGLLNALEKNSEAANHYEALLKIDPNHVAARLLLAQIYGHLKDPAKAKTALTPLLRDSKLAWKANLALGRAYVHIPDLKKSLHYFNKAKKLAPDELEPVLALGAALQELGRPKEAENMYRDFLARDPDNETIHSRLGRLLLTQEDRSAALEEFRAIARLSPDSVQARLTAALILLSQRNYEEALQELRLAEASRPGSSGVSYYIGQALEALDRTKDAQLAYTSIKPEEPFHIEAQVRLAFIDASDKQGKQAITRLKELTKKHPDRIELLLALTIIQLQEEEYGAVVDTASKGLTLDPEQSRFLFNRAMAFDKLQRWPEAEQDLQNYIGKHPDDAHALNYLGYTWADRNIKLEDSYNLIYKASQLAPSDGFIIDSLGWVLFRMNRLEESLIKIREAVRMEPQDPTIREHLGDVLAATGQIKEALIVWQQALDLNDNNQPLKTKILKNQANTPRVSP